MTTRDHIIQLAKECGFVGQELDWFSNTIPAFYHAAQREAYEKAAQVCDDLSSSHKRQVGGECDEDCDIVLWFDTCAEAIRKLKEGS